MHTFILLPEHIQNAEPRQVYIDPAEICKIDVISDHCTGIYLRFGGLFYIELNIDALTAKLQPYINFQI